MKSCDNVAANERGVLLVPDSCATLRFSTAGMPEPARVQAVRDLHIRERTFLPAGLESIEPLEPLPGRLLQIDVIKRTVSGLAVVSATLSGLRHAIRPRGAVANFFHERQAIRRSLAPTNIGSSPNSAHELEHSDPLGDVGGACDAQLAAYGP